MSKTNTIPGSKGGKAVVRLYGREYMSEIGREGGLVTSETYGTEWMSLIGTLGADSVNGHLSENKLKRVQGRLNRIYKEVNN